MTFKMLTALILSAALTAGCAIDPRGLRDARAGSLFRQDDQERRIDQLLRLAIMRGKTLPFTTPSAIFLRMAIHPGFACAKNHSGRVSRDKLHL